MLTFAAKRLRYSAIPNFGKTPPKDMKELPRQDLVDFMREEIDAWDGPTENMDSARQTLSVVKRSKSPTVGGLLDSLAKAQAKADRRTKLLKLAGVTAVGVGALLLAAGPHGTTSIANSVPHWLEAAGAFGFWGGLATTGVAALGVFSGADFESVSKKVNHWAKQVPN